MSMLIDMIWEEDDSVSFRTSCARCSFAAAFLRDEETATALWRAHTCV